MHRSATKASPFTANHTLRVFATAKIVVKWSWKPVKLLTLLIGWTCTPTSRLPASDNSCPYNLMATATSASRTCTMSQFSSSRIGTRCQLFLCFLRLPIGATILTAKQWSQVSRGSMLSPAALTTWDPLWALCLPRQTIVRGFFWDFLSCSTITRSWKFGSLKRWTSSNAEKRTTHSDCMTTRHRLSPDIFNGNANALTLSSYLCAKHCSKRSRDLFFTQGKSLVFFESGRLLHTGRLSVGWEESCEERWKTESTFDHSSVCNPRSRIAPRDRRIKKWKSETAENHFQSHIQASARELTTCIVQKDELHGALVGILQTWGTNCQIRGHECSTIASI